MKKHITSTAIPTYALKTEALAGMSASFERFCLAAGIESLTEMLEEDAVAACGARHERGKSRKAHRWGRTKGKIGFHGGKVEVERPRVRGRNGVEYVLPSWESAASEDWLGRWAMNQMLINVSTRKFKRSVRLPEGDVPAADGAGLSKSATSRRFVALSTARMREWMSTRTQRPCRRSSTISLNFPSPPRRDPAGVCRPPRRCRAPPPAACPRPCQIYKARNILERLPKSMHASVRSVLRQAWEMDDAAKAEKLLRNLARRLERDWEGVAASILEGLDEMLTVTRLGLPRELRRSLACTNIIENVMGTVRRVCRNVKYWRSPSMAMRWTAAAMQEATKGFRKLKAFKQLPALRAALDKTNSKPATVEPLAQIAEAA